MKCRHRGYDDKPLVWTLCVEASMGTVPPFRARKGGQVVGRGFGGPRPTDKKDSQEKTVRQLVVTAFCIQGGEGPLQAD